MTKLLPCPFCGSNNIDPEGWASTERAGPACDDCAGTADTIELLKYGVRHYAHFKCYLDAGKSLDELHSWQVGQFPYRLLKERGLDGFAKNVLKGMATSKTLGL